MIGFSPKSPYDLPENPDFIISSIDDGSPEESGGRLFNFIHDSFNLK